MGTLLAGETGYPHFERGVQIHSVNCHCHYCFNGRCGSRDVAVGLYVLLLLLKLYMT